MGKSETNTKKATAPKAQLQGRKPFYEDLLATDLPETYAEILQAQGELDGKKLQYFNAALLYRFIEEYENGAGIHRSVLEFFYHSFIDVLEGHPFDQVIRLPGRELRSEWEDMPRAQREQQEAAQHVSHLLSIGFYASEAVAVEEAARLWHKSESWVRAARTQWAPSQDSRKTKKSGVRARTG